MSVNRTTLCWTLLAATLMIGVAAQASGEDAHLVPPVLADGAELENQDGTLLLEEGTAPFVASVTQGYVEVWTKEIPCLERDTSTCMYGSAGTEERSIDATRGSVTITPIDEDDREPRIGVIAEDAMIRLETPQADIGLQSDNETTTLVQDPDAPDEKNQILHARGASVTTPSETNVSVAGTQGLIAVDAVVTVQANDEREDLETGWGWEENENGGVTYYRTLTLIRAHLEGHLTAPSWDGTVQLAPQLPVNLVANEATVNLEEGSLGNATPEDSNATIEDARFTLAGIEWNQQEAETSQGPTQVQTEDGDELEGWLVAAPETQDLTTPASTTQESTTGTMLGISGAIFASLALIAYYWPRVSWLATVGILPLYSRIEKDDLLEHDVRQDLFSLVKEDPGIHAHALAEAAETGWGTTVYHLRRLERNGFVTSEKKGRYRRFFPASGFVERTREALSALQNENTSAVARLVLEEPGLNQSAICDELDISPSLANWHLNQLLDAGLVERERRGRTVHYTPGPAWEDLHQTVDLPYEDSLLEQAVPTTA